MGRHDKLKLVGHWPHAHLEYPFGLWLCCSAPLRLEAVAKLNRRGAEDFALDASFHRPYSHSMNYRDYITIDPNKRGGKPCVRGLRITVYEVLEYMASNMSDEQILADFPDLTREDLKACIAFAADRERRLTTIPAA
jgi:uncharacterized protein (DUF433 family)